MTAAGEVLLDEIARSGPVPFSRFMEVALYHPLHGYYCGGRDPFGRHGDFYTAEQLQPVFGILIAACMSDLFEELGRPENFTVVELGAGREELAPYLSEYRYVPVDVGRGELPEQITGVTIANEFFDALPVDLALFKQGSWLQMLVGCVEDRFVWVEGGPLPAEAEDYLRRYALMPEDGNFCEIHLEALRWLDRISHALDRGYMLAIDYGYTRQESRRFPRGTLMSYQKHQASEAVLADPGMRDITAHVPFTALEEYGAAAGLQKIRFETLAMLLLRAGEKDQFAAALAADSTVEEVRRRLQLKTLLFGMGESFRTLLAKKGGPKIKMAPKDSGPLE